MRKFLFLDIDGVVNSHRHYESHGRDSYYDLGSWEGWNPQGVFYLKYLLKEVPEIKMVIHSSWVHSGELVEKIKEGFRFWGISTNFDIANQGARMSCVKPYCIKTYKEKHNIKPCEYIVLDDDDMDTDNQIKTTFLNGLEWEHIEKAMLFFGKPTNTPEAG